MRVRIVMVCTATLVLGAAGTTSAGARTASAGIQRTWTRFTVAGMVSDVKGRAAITDPALVNPWGLAMGKTLWVSATGTDSATVYSGGIGTARQERTHVRIPGGRPTGQVVNPGQEFTIKGKDGSGPATFIFASPSGAITGWNAQADADDAIISAFVKNSDLKGLALARTNRGPRLFAADFAQNRVHVFDGDFDRLRLHRRAFRDPALPPDYAPFNVEVVGRSVLVAYAKRDPRTGKAVPGPGKGFVSQFDGDGRFLGRFATRGALNAPWAMTLAPSGFGTHAGALLVGNFGDGRINAYDPRTRRPLGPLCTPDGRPITLSGLWDLEPGTAANGGENALWFSSGPDGGAHGLLGLIRPADAGADAPTSSATPTAVPSSTSGY
ncbi:TIGR03118 family protein [Streptosporangium sp. NPDC000396]|uniref:TIGR03118 family protein n=1 Tax=Streptosporangium sp. NPDC000396 TaxID=3366185 RepID=UPI003674A86F